MQLLKTFWQKIVLILRFLQLQRQVQKLHRQGLYQQAIQLSMEVLVLSQRGFQDAHFPEVLRTIAEASSLNNLAELHREQGHYSEAEPLLNQALELWRSLLGNRHPTIATILNNLAELYEDRGCYNEAEDLHLQALDLRRSLLGNTNPAVAKSLNNLAALYYTQGRYSDAEPLFKQSLDLQQSLWGDKHPAVATSLNNLAALYYKQGRYSEAKTLYEQALELRRRLLGNDHPDVAVNLNNLAELYQNQGHYSEAEDLLRQALELKRRQVGNEHPAVANSLNNLAELYQAQGRYSEAETLHRQVLELRQRLLGDDHPAVVESLHNLASLYKNQGRYSEAEDILKQALELNQQLLGNDHPATGDILNNLASLYRSQGRYSEAKPLYEQALELRRRLLGSDHPAVAQSLNNLALLYSDQGCYSDSVDFCLQALELLHCQFGDGHPDISASLNNLAALYKDQGRYNEAVSFYLQALKLELSLLGDHHPGMAASFNNLANLCQDLGVYSAAEFFYVQALDLQHRQVGDKHPDVATSLDGLANLYHHQRRYGEAKPLYEKALELRRSLLGNAHPAIATSLNNLASLYTSYGHYDEAEALHKQALDLRQRLLGNDHPDVIISLINLAALLASLSRFAEALVYMLQATKIEDRVIGQVFATSSESDRLAYLHILRVNFDGLISLSYESLSHSVEAVQSALDVTLKRKALTTTALASLNRVFSEGRYPHLTSEFQQLKFLSDQIIHLTFSPLDQENLITYQERLEQLRAQHNNLQRKLALQVPEIRLQEQLQSVNHRAVALELPEHAVLIEFVQFSIVNFNSIPSQEEAELQLYYLAFILPANQPELLRMVPLGPAKEIDCLIQAFRFSVLPVSNTAESHLDFGSWDDSLVLKTMKYSPIDGIKLRETIFDPIYEHLDKDCKHLLIAPDGELSLVPFQILPVDEKGAQLLMDEYNISYLNVGREILRSKIQPIYLATTPIVIADPDFDLGVEGKTNKLFSPPRKPAPELLSPLAGNRLSRALGTRFLGESVAKKLKDTQLYLGAKALETHLANSRSPSIMLIATHGVFLPNSVQEPSSLGRGFFESDRFSRVKVENPMMQSGLALAGANTWLSGRDLPPEAGKGFVFAQDLAHLDLWATEIVVLSACNTARGAIKVGEGVFGLRRAFAVAGAETLVMSLWKVPDKVTALLMDRFFDNLQGDCGRHEALQEAQSYIRAITIRELRQSPLGLEVLKELLGVEELDSQTSLSCSEDDHPLKHVFYWGAWICQGNVSPLKKKGLFKAELSRTD